MSWNHVIHLGDLPLTMAAAAAMTVWMVCTGAWRLAFWWSLLFLIAIATVAASKVAHIAWETYALAPSFRALSGHATGITAVAVVLCYLASPRRAATQLGGIGAGLVLGALMVLLLVVHQEHSFAEAAAGWAVGALAGIGAIRLAGRTPTGLPGPGWHRDWGWAWSAAVFVGTVMLFRELPIGYLMWRAARLVARHASALASASF